VIIYIFFNLASEPELVDELGLVDEPKLVNELELSSSHIQ